MMHACPVLEFRYSCSEIHCMPRGVGILCTRSFPTASVTTSRGRSADSSPMRRWFRRSASLPKNPCVQEFSACPGIDPPVWVPDGFCSAYHIGLLAPDPRVSNSMTSSYRFSSAHNPYSSSAMTGCPPFRAARSRRMKFSRCRFFVRSRASWDSDRSCLGHSRYPGGSGCQGSRFGGHSAVSFHPSLRAHSAGTGSTAFMHKYAGGLSNCDICNNSNIQCVFPRCVRWEKKTRSFPL
jgi:hypothetical protein